MITPDQLDALDSITREFFDTFVTIGLPIDMTNEAPACTIVGGMSSARLQRFVTLLRVKADELESYIHMGQGPPQPPHAGHTA